jgi:hypothetical protein
VAKQGHDAAILLQPEDLILATTTPTIQLKKTGDTTLYIDALNQLEFSSSYLAK